MPKLNVFPANGMNPVTGYGKCEIGLEHGLRAAGVDVRLCKTGDALNGTPLLIIGDPAWTEHFPQDGQRWLYTMSESTRVSPLWVGLINEHFERVLLTCESMVEVYRQSGVMVPMEVIGCGVDHFVPEFRRRTLPEEGQPFIFLTYSRGDMRKGAELAMLAFNRCFGEGFRQGDRRYHMVVKAPPSPHWVEGVRDEQVTVLSGHISEREWNEMLQSAHAFVFPSRAEGFGLPPREATLSGLPTLATEWLGLDDIARWGYPLPVKELRPSVYGTFGANAEDSEWAEPDAEAIDHWMCWLTADALHYEEACDQAERGREYLLANSSYLAMGQRIKRFLAEQTQEPLC